MRRLFLFLLVITFSCSKEKTFDEQIENRLKKDLLDLKPNADQQKNITTEAGYTWTNAKASMRYPKVKPFKDGAQQGFEFLRDVLWDRTNGGFHESVQDDTLKTAYGNAFGLFALTAYYQSSGDQQAYQFAKQVFEWLEAHNHDHEYKGYFQYDQIGYKDRNSSMHLLEAFTELYKIWPDPLLRERLREMLFLIRDTMVNEDGYLASFFERNWTPVIPDSTAVPFDQDMETAYLMIEASTVLGIDNDVPTQRVAKKIVDHALKEGWNSSDSTRIFYEGMDCLLLMSDLYPGDSLNYYDKFLRSWQHVNKNLADHDASYHEYRALSNCVDLLRAKSTH